MRVLIVSRTPWDNSNSFGNTFSNLFGDMEDVEIYNICCQGGNNSNSIVKGAYQMTDSSVLKSILGRDAGCRVDMADTNLVNAQPTKEFSFPKRRNLIFYIGRDLIWKFGHWKSKALRDFLDEVNPDVLYLPVYHSPYMNDVQRYVIKHCQVPYAVHISDDVASYPPDCLKSPLKALYHYITYRKIRRLCKHAKYGEAFAENMVREYPAKFNIPFFLIGKGVDAQLIPFGVKVCKSQNPVFVYTGNYGVERGRQLINLASAMQDRLVAKGIEAVLNIYSNTMVEESIKKELAKYPHVHLCKGVSAVEVKQIQSQADYLIHVEGFSKEAIASTRMSFSTKLIDYMLAMKPIIAIGPSNINSIEVLADNGLAYIANDKAQIETVLDSIASGDGHEEQAMSERVIGYLREKRDRKKIQHGMLLRLKSLKQNGSMSQN